MAYSIVQSKTGSGAYVNSLAVAFDSNVTAGNTIIVCVGTEADDSITGITDSQSNTYTKVFRNASSNGSVELWVAENITGGANTYTIQLGSQWNPIASVGVEVSGLSSSSEDVSSSANTGGYPTEYATGDTSVPTQDNNLVVALPGLKGNNTFTPSASGFTLEAQVSSSSDAHTAFLHKRITSATAQGTTISWGGNLDGGVGIAVFKEAGAAPATAVKDVIGGVGIIPFAR